METELNHLTANMAALESENNKLRAELTEARLVIAGFQSGVTPCDCQPGEFCKPSAPVPQPAVKVGDSFFESWYSLYNPEGKSTKQTMREAYAAGLVDREGRTDWQPAVPEAVAKDARLGNRLYVWDYENPEDGSWDNIEEYLHDTTPNVGEVVRLNLALPLTDVVVEMLEVGESGEPIRWEVRDVKTGAILSATDSEVKK